MIDEAGILKLTQNIFTFLPITFPALRKEIGGIAGRTSVIVWMVRKWHPALFLG
jgi:hypothetical protein